jgi:hypothetical protein
VRRFRLAVLGILLVSGPLLGGKGKDCLGLSAVKDDDVSSPSGISVTITGQNHCSEDVDGSKWRFKVAALGSGGAEIASRSGRFGGTVTPRGQVETKVFLTCDPERVRSVKVSPVD